MQLDVNARGKPEAVWRLDWNVIAKNEGSVAEWLGSQTWNPKIAGFKSRSDTKLELFLGRP